MLAVLSHYFVTALPIWHLPATNTAWSTAGQEIFGRQALTSQLLVMVRMRYVTISFKGEKTESQPPVFMGRLPCFWFGISIANLENFI